MHIKILFIIILVFIFSSCSSDRITYKTSDVYGDEHFQHASIEFFQGSSTVSTLDAIIDYLDDNNSGGGSTCARNHISITSKSIRGFVNPEVIDLKISNIKTENGDDLPYSFQDKIAVDTVEKCQSYVTVEPNPPDKAFVLRKIHVSPYSIFISGLGTLKKPLNVEVVNSLGESFKHWESTSESQEPDSFMLVMSFFNKIDNTNITTILIAGIPYKVVPSESDIYE